MRVRLWLTLGALGACAVDDFVTARGEAVCARHARCGTLDDAGFESEVACRAAMEDAAADQAAGGELGCAGFDAGAADACVAAWSEAACDAAPDLSACEAVCQD